MSPKQMEKKRRKELINKREEDEAFRRFKNKSFLCYRHTFTPAQIRLINVVLNNQ